jgi:hypothetical protein
LNKKQFWTRFSLYAVIGLIIPIVFLIWRFQLFKKVSTNGIAIGGWGVVVFIIFVVFFSSMLKAIKKGLPFSLTTHVITCIVKVTIPLLIATFVVYFLQDFTTELFQVLCVLLVCETAASIVNPLPQWAHEHQVDAENMRIKSVFSSLMGEKEK